MIYVGYQGVGKSTLAGKKNCIDLESSNFTIDGKKPKGWEKIYFKIAEERLNGEDKEITQMKWSDLE